MNKSKLLSQMFMRFQYFLLDLPIEPEPYVRFIPKLLLRNK